MQTKRNARPAPEFSGNERYEVVRRLGMGGMGIVYEALDRERQQRVALKTFRSMSPDALLKLKDEFRAIQDIGHPNLIQLVELHGEGAAWFFTMELVEGADFLHWVRPAASRRLRHTIDVSPSDVTMPGAPLPIDEDGGELDEARLRAALPQLCRALVALHAAGKVHRDIKPSNILVDGSGRVVLLDFGLVTDLTRAEQLEAGQREIVGTVEYMAPEQAAAQPIGPEADCYAVGVVLYQALTGQLPLSGTVIEVLTNKQRATLAPPSKIAPGVPPDLDALCAELLRRNPAERPTPPQILERLGERTPRERTSMPSRPQSLGGQGFVGRSDELQILEDALLDTRAGRTSIVVVTGESGMGKTALVQRFTNGVVSTHAGAVVLFGRCYERESVPYKAVDGIIDALSKYLVRLSKADAAALLPRHAALLSEVFPVLSRVEALADAPLPQRVLDPLELRGRVFSALRELFARIADRYPLVLVVDDLQWADADSLALLDEVLRPADAPRLLLVGTARPIDDAPLAVLADLPGPPREVALSRLGSEEAHALAQQLGQLLAPEQRIELDALVAESGGHPLFLDELIRYKLSQARADVPIQLEAVLRARIDELAEPARHLLELVALFGGPMRQQTAAQASSAKDFIQVAGLLRAQRLVRTSGMRETDRIEIYHDRVRAAVTQALTESTRRTHHRRLALALETGQSGDLESLLHHWRGAGENSKAAQYAKAVAEKAERALAFDRAARLYAECIALGAREPERTRELLRKMGDALANAGRGAEAAEAYVQAAHGANVGEALDLRRRAAEQLLRSGRITQGLDLIREVLQSVGMSLATTPARALASVIMQRARLRMRGLSFQERDVSQISSNDLTRIDVCWSVGVGLSMVDTIRGSDFQTRNLRLALEAGEPYRIARALALESMYSAAGGSGETKRTKRLLAACSELVARGPNPHLRGLSKMSIGVAAFLEGRFAEARSVCLEAEQIFREECSGVAWELAFCQSFIHWSLYFVGDLPELRRRVPLLVAAAEERGDLYALTNLRTEFLTLVAMMADDVPWARRAIVEAMQGWTNEGFHIEHAWEIHVSAQIDLYDGDPQGAYDRVCGAWSALERSLALQIEQLKIEFVYLRGRSAVAAAAKSGLARSLMKAGRADAARLQKSGAAWAHPLGEMLHGSLHALEGRRADAARALEAAIAGFGTIGMATHASAARYRLAELQADQEAVAKEAAWFRDRYVHNPARWVDFVAAPTTAVASTRP